MKKTILTLLAVFAVLTSLSAYDDLGNLFSDSPQPLATVTRQRGIEGNGAVAFSLAGYPADRAIVPLPFFSLDLTGNTQKTSVALFLDSSESQPITNLSLSIYEKNIRIEAGLLTKEWGSGDGVHVVDVLNALDYSEGIVDDLASMKIPQPMIMTTATWGNTTWELVYEPTFTPMKTAQEGRYSLLPAAFLSPGGSRASISYPDTANFDYSQFGTRIKTVWGPADLALLYFNGFYSQPGYKNLTYDVSDPSSPYVTSVDIQYTRAQLFGTEATIIAGPFTFMLEGGYWLSEDEKGTDLSLYNSKWVYESGVGLFLFGTQAYATVMYNGQWIEHFDQVNALYGDVDAYQALGGKAYQNTLTAALSLPLARETVNIRLALTYQMETKGYAFLPSLSYSVNDNVSLFVKGRIFGLLSGDEDSVFKSWKNNDSLTIKLSYLFTL